MARPLKPEQLGESPVVTFRAPAELVRKIDHIAARTGRPRPELMREALAAGLDHLGVTTP
jgi:predicted transcriptional regulator